MELNKLVLILLVTIVTAEVDYGYFNIKVNYIKTCQGPKRKSCCMSTVGVEREKVVSYTIDCQEKVNPTRGKIVASMKDREKVRLQMNKPCSHIFIKPFFLSVFNATRDCTIAKGVYKFHFDYADIMKTYYRGMFFYGNWTFENIFYSETCNFLCTVAELNIYPKTN